MNYTICFYQVLRRFRWAIIVVLGMLLIAAQCNTDPEEAPTDPKETPWVGELIMQPPAGTPLEPDQEVSLWVNPTNLDSPIYTWRVSLNDKTITEEQGKRFFSFTPNEPGTYKVSLEVADGGATFRPTPVSIAVEDVIAIEPTPTPTSKSTDTLSPPPTNTPTPTDTPSPPPTDTPPPIDTSTPTPTDTPTPTNTSTATPTYTPSITPTYTPIATPTEELVEDVYKFERGPELYHPQHAVSYTMGDHVVFTWEEYPLAIEKNQYYSIMVFHRDLSEKEACIHKQTQMPEIDLKLDCPKGIYKWKVVIATRLPEDSEEVWRTDSKDNNVREFGLDEQHPDQPPDGGGNGGGGSVGGG